MAYFFRPREVKTRAGILAALLFLGGYAVLLAWFKYVDVYHAHFSETGILVVLNNLFRVLFVFYLFWIVQAAGALVLRLVGGFRRDAFDPLEYLALTFFAGTGPWQIVVLAVGFANLLNAPVMMLLTAPMAVLSWRELRQTIQRLRPELAGIVRASISRKAIYLLLGLVWCTLLLLKGLYPAGSQDYFVQYARAYQDFIEHGSLWPNEAWVHYFYSKGAGLFFLGILLTDPLAPPLVTFCLISAAALVVFVFVGRLAADTAWPLAAVLLLTASYVYTPGWAEFGKLHEFNTAFVIAVLWMTAMALGSGAATRKLWLAGAASTLTAAIVVNNGIAIYLATVLALIGVIYAGIGGGWRSLECIGLATLAGVLYGGNLAINYLTTGVLTGWDPSFPYLWPFADLERLDRWGALPSALRLTLTFSGGTPFLRPLNFLNFTSRFYLLWPLVVGGALVAAISAWQQRQWNIAAKATLAGDERAKRQMPFAHVALVLGAALAVFAALTVSSGRAMPNSYYRLASFLVPVMIVVGAAMWTVPLRWSAVGRLPAMVRHPATSAAVLVFCATLLAVKTPIARDIGPLTANGLKFTGGLLSVDSAYTHQGGGEKIGPWGGIYPGARGAYAIAGPHTPIWTMHQETYCMLPDCRMMSSPFYLMSRSLDLVMWGTPEEGKRALRTAGINYFLFSRELPIRDPVFFSPLFSPDTIATHLAIRWTDGTSTLLTWPGPQTTAPDAAWLATYRQAVDASPDRAFPNAAMKAIFERFHATPHPSRAIELPWRMH